MKILITRIGCVGKSFLREKIALDFPNNVISVDMDYDKAIPSEMDNVVIVESVYGLEKNPQIFDIILYLLPFRSHIILWLKRVWTWFATGFVDLSAPKGKRKQFALSNIPVISKILIRNISRSKSWVKADITLLQQEFSDKIFIASSKKGYKVIEFWLQHFMNKGAVIWK